MRFDARDIQSLVMRLAPDALVMDQMRMIVQQSGEVGGVHRLRDSDIADLLVALVMTRRVQVCRRVIPLLPWPRQPAFEASRSTPVRGVRVAEPVAEKGVMSISFVIDRRGHVERDYPKYQLESNDGAYNKELSPRNDLVPHDNYLQLRFEGLTPDHTYRLTRKVDQATSEVVFSEASYDTLVERPRRSLRLMVDHTYAFDGLETKSSGLLASLDFSSDAPGAPEPV